MNVAALIIGIDGWQKYTAPLIESIATHEPECLTIVIDNASAEPYPMHESQPILLRTERLCYSAAINKAHDIAMADWYIVLSNDVLCTGPFADQLSQVPSDSIAGPCLKETRGYQYLEGWCVCVPSGIWSDLNGWDENFIVSSWEDVDFTQTTLEAGYNVVHDESLPFVHLDQRQRFNLVSNYWDSERHNIDYFDAKRRAAA